MMLLAGAGILIALGIIGVAHARDRRETRRARAGRVEPMGGFGTSAYRDPENDHD
jgi:hypothetical protein